MGGLQASLKKQQKVGLKATRQASRQAKPQYKAQSQSHEAGREAGEAGVAGVEASLEASMHEASVQGSKALRQASVASLGHGLQAEQRRTNEARHKKATSKQK